MVWFYSSKIEEPNYLLSLLSYAEVIALLSGKRSVGSEAIKKTLLSAEVSSFLKFLILHQMFVWIHHCPITHPTLFLGLLRLSQLSYLQNTWRSWKFQKNWKLMPMPILQVAKISIKQMKRFQNERILLLRHCL